MESYIVAGLILLVVIIGATLALVAPRFRKPPTLPPTPVEQPKPAPTPVTEAPPRPVEAPTPVKKPEVKPAPEPEPQVTVEAPEPTAGRLVRLRFPQRTPSRPLRKHGHGQRPGFADAAHRPSGVRHPRKRLSWPKRGSGAAGGSGHPRSAAITRLDGADEGRSQVLVNRLLGDSERTTDSYGFQFAGVNQPIDGHL